MAKLRCQCGHKFEIDFERLTVQSARKVRCPECGLSFPLAEKRISEPTPEVAISNQPISPSIMSPFTNSERPAQTSRDDEDDWPIAIPLSELRHEPELSDKSHPPIVKLPVGQRAIIGWVTLIVAVFVLSTGAIFNGMMPTSTAGIVVTNLLLSGILFELWRIRRLLEN